MNIVPHVKLLHPTLFTEGTRVLMRVSRKKDGGGSPFKMRYISRASDQFEGVLDEAINEMGDNERIYGSVDPRDVTKAIYEFKRRQLDADFGNVTDPDFYFRVQSHWTTSLMQNQCRSSKYFLWDLDTADLHDFFMAQWLAHREKDIKNGIQPSNILHTYATRTPGARHIITEPFNYLQWPELLRECVKVNALMLWAWRT